MLFTNDGGTTEDSLDYDPKVYQKLLVFAHQICMFGHSESPNVNIGWAPREKPLSLRRGTANFQVLQELQGLQSMLPPLVFPGLTVAPRGLMGVACAKACARASPTTTASTHAIPADAGALKRSDHGTTRVRILRDSGQVVISGIGFFPSFDIWLYLFTFGLTFVYISFYICSMVGCPLPTETAILNLL